MPEDTVFFYHTNLVMLQRRIIKFSMKRTNIVCNIKIFLLLEKNRICADGSLRQKKVTHNVKRYATKESKASGEARSDPLQCARSDSSQEEVGVADVSEADRDAVEGRGDFWSGLSPRHGQRTLVYTERVIILMSLEVY